MNELIERFKERLDDETRALFFGPSASDGGC